MEFETCSTQLLEVNPYMPGTCKKINSQYIINISIEMTSTQISIRRDVYEKLKREKQDDESFSDVIERLIEKKSNV